MTSTTSWRHRRIRLSLWALAAFAWLVFGGAYLVQSIYSPEPLRSTSSGEAAIRSKFALTDHTGNRVTEADFYGRWQIVFFGFTYCPDVCPTTLAYLADVFNRLGDRGERIAPIFITIDPSRDTPDVMAEYVRAFHPKLVGLTGSDAEIAAAAQAFRVYYEKMEDASAPDGYLMAHAGHIYLMTPKGRFETVFREHEQTSQEMAADLASRIEKEKQ